MTTQDVIQTLKSTFQFVKRELTDLLNYILTKQPPDRRLVKKYMYLRI